MKSNNTKVHEWYLLNVNPGELDKKIKATIDYLKRVNDPEDERITVWAFEIVSGSHGQYTVRVFLDEVLNQGHEKYMNVEDSEDHTNELMRLYDEVSGLVAKEFQRGSKLVGEFYIGHHEADGSLGVYYSIRRSEA